MPSRDDEFWAILKKDLRYCDKHNRHYDVGHGCQLCGQPESIEKKSVPLKVCPKCGQSSLVWSNTCCVYDCLNIKCKALIPVSEILNRQ